MTVVASNPTESPRRAVIENYAGSREIPASCTRCGSTRFLGSGPSLPPDGGMFGMREGAVTSFVCGPCCVQRARTWTCAECGGEGFEGANFCSGCHSVRPDPLPYFVDLDLLAKEERERQRERDALVAEWDREFPGWRSASLGPRERL